MSLSLAHSLDAINLLNEHLMALSAIVNIVIIYIVLISKHIIYSYNHCVSVYIIFSVYMIFSVYIMFHQSIVHPININSDVII